MAQAVASNTDELLSQLAASEIDRLLAEADSPAPAGKPDAMGKSDAAGASDAAVAEAIATAVAEVSGDGAGAGELRAGGTGDATAGEGLERAALLQAAGFETAALAGETGASAAVKEAGSGDERSAILQAAGFESPLEIELTPRKKVEEGEMEAAEEPVPIYLKPLVWINAPLDSAPVVVRQVLGKVGLVTLINALAVLGYVIFFRKH
jgi:hypothetical protein